MKKPTRIFDFIYIQQEKFNLDKAFSTKYNGKWKSTSTTEFIEQINQVSKALIKLGVKKGDKLAMISSSNRTEWNIIDHAILQLGAVNIPIYPTITTDEFAYIFNHSEATYCFVSDRKIYDKVKQAQTKSPSIKTIYSFDKIEGCNHWQELLELEIPEDTQQLDELKNAVLPNDLATIIYTSGTTGAPKGVMLSHNNIVYNVLNTDPRIPMKGGVSRFFSFLPACHSFERMVHYLCINAGAGLYFAESMDKLIDNIQEVKPHIMTTVPRMLEKVYDNIMDKGKELNGLKRLLFFWATGLGIQYKPYGVKSWWYETQLKIAQKIIFSQWRKALGNEIEVIVSGSAALQSRLTRMFTAAGMPIVEGYGLTESSPVIAVNDFYNKTYKIGSVGPAIENIKIKIAEDGEILCKGSIVMLGYYKDPKLTNKTIVNGWLHTGDKGRLDKDGFLYITGRKKEIFKTSGGKYISPTLLENEIKKSHFIEQIVVLGEGRKMPVAIIQPDFKFVKSWAKRKKINLSSNNEELITNKKLIDRIQQDVDHYNERFAKWEKVKKFELVSEEWSIDNGLLTPTLKTKRKEVLRKYKALCDKMYIDE